MKDGIGGYRGTYPTVRKCVDQKRGIPKTLPRHQSSRGYFHHSCQGPGEGHAERITCTDKREPGKDLSFCQCKGCREEGEDENVLHGP